MRHPRGPPPPPLHHHHHHRRSRPALPIAILAWGRKGPLPAVASALRKECLHQRLAAAMQSGRLTRRTLAGEPLTDFPIKQFWVQNDTGELWWDLDYLYAHFRNTSVTKKAKCKWLGAVKAVLSSAPATSGSCHVHLHRSTQPANLLNANTCTTVGVLVILAE